MRPEANSALSALFVQDIFTPLPRLQITGALRFDYWQNGDASRTDRPVADGQITRTPFADRSDTAVSPKFAILYPRHRSPVATRCSLSSLSCPDAE